MISLSGFEPIYEGEKYNGLRHGIGYESSRFGTKTYEGQWENDQRSGQGREVNSLAYPTYEYQGEWRQNERHGFGQMFWHYVEGDRTYEGSWSHGVQHGQGRSSYPDGTAFIGQWNHGLRGRGKRIYANGGEEHGQWINDGINDVWHRETILEHLARILREVRSAIRVRRG